VQFSIGVEYAFHSLFYLLGLPPGKVIGIKGLAALHGVSETYLSKVFTRLRKGGIVRSMPGVNGGYEFARAPEDISFWDIVEAVEGPAYLFQCVELRRKNILPGGGQIVDPSTCPCLIKVVMTEAEDKMREHLRGKSLRWLQDNVVKDFSNEKKRAIAAWQKSSTGR
jgi:Rrf2 family protein